MANDNEVIEPPGSEDVDAKGNGFSRQRTKLEQSLRTVDRRIEESNKSFFTSMFSVFYPANYDEVEVPPEAIRHDDNGNEYVVPQVIKPWVCRYYYQPERKARLARHTALALAMIVLSLVPVFTRIPGGIGALILGVLLLINFQFRFRDIALWKWPMPEIPFLSSLDLGGAITEAQIRSEEMIREREEYERMVEGNTSVEFVAPVRNYRKGNASPATILTTWMNVSAQMDEDDFIDASDGKLNSFTMNLLLEDSEGAWKDPTILDTVSYITKTNAQDWLDAYETWSTSKEDE